MFSVEHKKHTPAHLRFAVLTVSTSRYRQTPSAKTPEEAEDGSGTLMRELTKKASHTIQSYQLVPDDVNKIRDAVAKAASLADVILISGGTGIAPEDVTIEAITPLFAREIPGFGEFFRTLSQKDIGGAAMLSRATAGITNTGTIIFCLPGSPGGARLALEKLILPEVGHLVRHARGG